MDVVGDVLEGKLILELRQKPPPTSTRAYWLAFEFKAG